MPPKLVQVGNDVVEFPENMSDAQIQAILVNQSNKSSFLTGLAEPLTGLEQLAGKVVEQFYPSPEVKATNEAIRQRQSAEEQELAQARRMRGDTGIDFARLGGNIANPLSFVPGLAAERALVTAITNPAVRAAIGGGVSALTQPVTGEDYGTEKATQVGVGTVAGPIFQKGIETGARVLQPQVSAFEKKIRELGVTPTIGESLGGVVQSVEQFLETLPLVGPKIRAAKEDTFNDFRLGIINRALAKVDEKLPKGMDTYEALQKMVTIKDNKYDAALKGTSFTWDNPALSKLVQTMQGQKFNTPDQKRLYDSILNNQVFDFFSKTTKIDGQAFKSLESDLSKQIYSLRTSQSLEDKQVGQALQDTLDTLKSVFRRQNPDKASELRRVDSLYRDLSLIQDASARSQTGKFSPQNYNQAVKTASEGRKKRQFGTGKAYNQDVATAGVEFLGDPERDLTRQVATGALAGGAGYGAYITDPTLAYLFGLGFPLAYTKSGKTALDYLLARRPEAAQKAGAALKAFSPELSLFGPEAIRQYNIGTRTKDNKTP